jgi:hypothetical protein
MLVNVNQVLFDMNDMPISDADGKEATLRKVSIEALAATYQDESTLSGEEKLKRFELAMKVKNTPTPIDLTVEEVATIKKLIGKAFGVIVVGQAWKMLEGSN